MKSMYKKIYVNLYSSPQSVVACKGTQSSWWLYATNHRASNPDDTPLTRTHHHNHPTNSTIVTHAPDVVITCSLMRELPRAIPCEGRYRGPLVQEPKVSRTSVVWCQRPSPQFRQNVRVSYLAFTTYDLYSMIDSEILKDTPVWNLDLIVSCQINKQQALPSLISNDTYPPAYRGLARQQSSTTYLWARHRICIIAQAVVSNESCPLDA
jgi:hypothetical protein